MRWIGLLLAAKLLTTVGDDRIAESSGIAPSRRHAGAYWTHNDSGSGPHLYLFTGKGMVLGRVTLKVPKPVDWEGLASTPEGYVYVGDIGNNSRARRVVSVHRFREPESFDRALEAETFHLEYPETPHDAEALLVHPFTRDVYIVTKARGADQSTYVYAARAPLRPLNRLKRVATIDFPDESALTLLVGRVTGGDISPDGRHVILCDYFRGWEFILPAGAKTFDEIWKTRPSHVDLGARIQGEAVTYRLDMRTVVATSESSPMRVYESEVRK